VDVIGRFRTIATTVAAVAVGIINVATRRGESAIELKAGDAAPDFSLPASDGRTYHLRELAGQVVAIAWFPKAFTGG
jgi:cytochrome oxidase Cu insertion factor (SCO1/SenC/PrrC family)